eukprot:628139-Pyramimonas_sp.AAC.1
MVCLRRVPITSALVRCFHTSLRPQPRPPLAPARVQRHSRTNSGGREVLMEGAGLYPQNFGSQKRVPF